MKAQEQKEISKSINQQIKFIKTLNPEYIKDGFRAGLDLLIWKTSEGFNCKFGIDGCYPYQIKNEFGNVRTKTDCINKLKWEKEQI